MTAQLPILFLSVIQKRVKLLVYSIWCRQFRPFQICLHHFHAILRFIWQIKKFIIRQPPIGEKDDYDSENSWISDGLPSSNRRRRRGGAYNRKPGCTLENSKWTERGVVPTIWCKKPWLRAFQICIHLYCAIIGVSYTENPGYALENRKWAERVAVLTIRRRKIRAFQICFHFYCAIIGVLFAELKIIKAFQWISLSKKTCTHSFGLVKENMSVTNMHGSTFLMFARWALLISMQVCRGLVAGHCRFLGL